jgi:GMP synthase (glutamine-hydrolysing)
MSGGRVVVVNINPQAATRSGTRALVRTLQRLAPEARVLERHFKRLGLDGLAALAPTAIIIGPQGVPFDAYEGDALAGLFELLRGLEAPTLAVCGGHQALALAYGGRLGAVHGGEAAKSYSGMQKERGFRAIVGRIEDPILAKLPSPASMFVSHVEEVKELPAGFKVLAVGDPCRIQLVRVGEQFIYGCQFHPERGGDGEQLLRNFLRIARISG